MKKAIIGIAIAAGLFTNVSFANFSDVSESHWAYYAIEKMQKNGILSGYIDGTFKPSKNISLAEFATIFTKVFEIPKSDESNYFTDIAMSHWAKGNIEAVRKYINPYYDSLGENLGFDEYSYMAGITGDLEMTREAFVYAIAKIFGYDESDYIEGDEKILFDDYEDILFPKEIVLAYKNGVIKGENVNGKIYIRPNRPITRAEASSIFSNLLGDYDRVRNRYEDNELINSIDNVIEKVKESDFESIKDSVYDTAKVLENEYFTISEENMNMIKEVAEKYFKKFDYEVIETGFNGFNQAYAKVKIKGYDIKNDITSVFNDVSLKFEEENIGEAMSECLANFSEGIKNRVIKVKESEEIFNFVKCDGEWKLWIQ